MHSHNEPAAIEAGAADAAAALPLAPPPVASPETPRDRTEMLKVSTRSRPSAVAGAIAGIMRTRNTVEVQSIGAGATNQAVKAIAIARAYLHDDGIDLCFTPAFIDVTVDGEERTALRLLIEPYTS